MPFFILVAPTSQGKTGPKPPTRSHGRELDKDIMSRRSHTPAPDKAFRYNSDNPCYPQIDPGFMAALALC